LGGGLSGSDVGLIILSTILLILHNIPISDALIGYDIQVTVNNSTHYEASQSTSVLQFQSSGLCSGNGNASRYDKIDGLAGNDFKETMYAKKGRLISNDKLVAISYIGYILISETVQNNSFAITINESLPTVIYHKNDIYYRGAGIYQKDVYSNNKDHIKTDYYADLYTKSVSYAGLYRGALVEAEVIPGQIREVGGRNYSTAIRLQSQSDLYSEFGFGSDGKFMDEVYRGNFKINNNLLNNHKITFFNLGDSEDWLPCCRPDLEVGLNGRELNNTIFDASKSKSY
jgi:hypothetical protein